MKKSNNVILTEGSITKQMLSFFWPIFIANVFSELYNITNSYICGNYISTEALSAVSSCSSILTITGYLFSGFATAAGIIIAKLYGAQKNDDLKKSVENIIIFALVFGICFTILSEIFTPFLLNIANVPPEIYQQSEIYLRVYILGDIFVLSYSMLFYTLRSIGDSRHPLYYQIASCFINIILGIVFVKYFDLGVAGVALATIISQLFVDILSLRLLFSMKEFQFKLKEVKFDFQVTKDILSIGIPAATQNTLIALSIMLIQSYINLYSKEAIAGIGVGNKVAWWAQVPLLAISTVITSFVGQNMGAEKFDRVKEGVRKCIIFGTLITFVLATIIFIFAEPIVSLFDKDPEVIYYGANMTRYMVYSYVPLAWSHIYNAACRGAGNMRFPLIIAVVSQCIVRYLVVCIGYRYTQNIVLIYLSGAIGYALAGVLAFVYYHFGSFTKEKHMR